MPAVIELGLVFKTQEGGAIKNALGMHASALYTFPFRQLTLKIFGFALDEANAVCIYEQRKGIIEKHEAPRPKRVKINTVSVF